MGFLYTGRAEYHSNSRLASVYAVSNQDLLKGGVCELDLLKGSARA